MFSGTGLEKPLRANVIRRHLYWLIVCAAASVCLVELSSQRQESLFISALARDVVERAGAADDRARVMALRDYLRRTVSFQNAPHDIRPFFRATARETLRSGKGYCGEVTRAFIRMADTLGIRARRINLYGSRLHVVAEADLGAEGEVIVDCQSPPQIAELEQLDRVMLRPEYDEYSTLHLRRWRLEGLFSQFKMDLGPFTYFIESPHALKAALWSLFVFGLVLTRLLKPVRWKR